MLTAEQVSERSQEIEQSPDLTALLQRLNERARPVLERMPVIPRQKALLTADGGVCPGDGTRLIFDPWSPGEHRCGSCGRSYRGERHDMAWAHYQHLWVAERAAQLAVLAALGGRSNVVERANALLAAYHCYPDYPNRDNVLGPSRLFFSTYLESIWITSYLASALLLQEAGLLAESTAEVVSAVAEDAANIVGDFDEGLSNRQTWHNAALASVAVWFEDEELATRAIEARSGMITHLLHGFGPDGMWFEGDNYHLFALRGQLVAMGWARQAGVDLLADPQLVSRLTAALTAPSLTALPDFTFPARKDSRFGVSLAQPMYLELWEIGLARLEGAGAHRGELWGWLDGLYRSPAPVAQTFDSYLHEAGEPPPPQQRTRADLSWWSLLEMLPAFPDSIQPWTPQSTLIEGQGLAVLRSHNRYVSLECGESGGGHGHPDRLNVVFHADGAYWLPDLGTGSYVARDLFWYRSTLAHNAPRLDRISQLGGAAVCDNFDQRGAWGWARGHYGDLSRTVIAGPRYVVDLLELTAPADHLLELPLHLTGQVEVQSAGHWVPVELADEFVQGAERFVPADENPLVLQSRQGEATLRVHLLFPGDLLRAQAPGIPGSVGLTPFYLLRAQGRNTRFVSVLESTRATPTITSLRMAEGGIEVGTADGPERHLGTVEGWEVRAAGDVVRLGGGRQQGQEYEPLVRIDRPLVARAAARHVIDPPSLDGSLDGFHTGEPLELDHEDQYRRSEEPYPGPEEFSARAFVNWNDEGLYLGVQVITPEVFPRDRNAPPLRLDNEPDEIHGDGIQLYLRLPSDDRVHGWLIVPASQGGELIVRPVSGMDCSPDAVRGAWRADTGGYTLTIAIQPVGWEPFRPGTEISFDLLVNQMRPGRLRRAGQLVWTGGGGWVWLRGDRQDPGRLGLLELS